MPKHRNMLVQTTEMAIMQEFAAFYIQQTTMEDAEDDHEAA